MIFFRSLILDVNKGRDKFLIGFSFYDFLIIGVVPIVILIIVLSLLKYIKNFHLFNKDKS